MRVFNYLVVYLIWGISITFGQDPLVKGDKYRNNYNVDLTDILRDYNVASNSCLTTSYTAGPKVRFKIGGPVGTTGSHFVFLSYNDKKDTITDPEYAKAKKYYCIKDSDIQLFFRKIERLAWGVVAVPYKLRFNPTQVFPGGSLGGYIGRRAYHGKVTSTMFFFVGFPSTVSLVNVNTSASTNPNPDLPTTKVGVAAGIGWVLNLTEEFQFGVLSGTDIFDGASTWTYGYQPWVGVSVGFNFLRAQEQKSASEMPAR